MALMGKQGLREAAQAGCDGAHYLHRALLSTGRFSEAFPGREFFNEFCLRYDGGGSTPVSSAACAWPTTW